MISSFDDMQLKEELLRGIYAYGFEKPSAIQQRAIMPCIKGNCFVATFYNFLFLVTYLVSFWFHLKATMLLPKLSLELVKRLHFLLQFCNKFKQM